MESKLVRRVQALYKNKVEWKEDLHLVFNILDVPAATPEQKPVFLNNNPYQCYMRQHEEDYKCKDYVVQRMLRDRDTIISNYSADAELLPNTGLDDLDKQTLRQFRKYHENESAFQNPDIMVLKNDLTGVKSDFMVPKDDLTGVKSDFMVPKDDLTGVKSDFMVSREPVLSAQERVAKELNLPWQLEAQITEYRQKERQTPEVTMSLVIEICRNRWVTAVQLSILLDRAVRPLRKNFLQPALLCHKLEHRYPDSHKHKKQAYRSIE